MRRSHLLVSVAVNVAVVAGVGYALRARQSAVGPAAPNVAASAALPCGAPQEAAPVLAEAQRRMDDALKAATALPSVQQHRQALSLAADLERRSSPQAIRDIGAALGASLGFAQRSYAPVAQPPAGDFDIDSQLPAAVIKRDGQTIVRWVDRDGRSRDEVVDAKHPLAQHGLALSALARLEDSAVLRSLKEDVFLKALDKLLPNPRAAGK